MPDRISLASKRWCNRVCFLSDLGFHVSNFEIILLALFYFAKAIRESDFHNADIHAGMAVELPHE
nr:hypothetical protein [uncultured Desulfobacter sp.]